MAEAVTPQASFISGKAAWQPGMAAALGGRVTSYRFDIALALSEHQGKEMPMRIFTIQPSVSNGNT